MQEMINRINFLYHKSKNEGLSEAEKEEQQLLRRKYVDNIKGNLVANLESMVIEKPDGTREKVQKKK